METRTSGTWERLRRRVRRLAPRAPVALARIDERPGLELRASPRRASRVATPTSPPPRERRDDDAIDATALEPRGTRRPARHALRVVSHCSSGTQKSQCVASKKTHRKSGRTIGADELYSNFREDAESKKKKIFLRRLRSQSQNRQKRLLLLFQLEKNVFFFSWTKWRVLETTNQQLARDIFRPIE